MQVQKVKAESKGVEKEMLWMCMRWRACNAKEAILAVHCCGCHLKPASCESLVGAEDATLSNARSGVRFPRHAMTWKGDVEVDVMTMEE